jgi:hypothetical protein
VPGTELGLGLASGVVAALLVVVATRFDARAGRAPTVGIALVSATLWAISRSRSIPIDVLVAIGGVGVAGAVARTRGTRLAIAVTVPSALVLAEDVSSNLGVQTLAFLAASVGALAVVRTDPQLRGGELSPVLFAMTVVGGFAAVPDTEEVAALLGVTAPMALLGWPFGRACLGSAGAASATALFVWVVGVGGRGRPPSVVGAITCLGLLAAVPAGRWLRARSSSHPAPIPPSSSVGALLVHCTAVLVASRGAGISDDMGRAAALSLLSASIAVGGAAALLGRSARARGPR